MRTESNKTITIIGAGLAGCFLTILLANRGYKVELYERLSKDKISESNSKRSYNITFRTYGIELLKKTGLLEDLNPFLYPLKGAYTQLSKNSKPIISLLKNENITYLSISRTDLLKVMLKKMEDNPLVSTHFGTAILSIDRHEKTIIIQHEKNKTIKSISCDVIIGADGANSSVRMFLQQGQDSNHSQEYSPGGYKQFNISKENVEKLQLRKDIAYTWSADEKFILAFPNRDHSLSALLIYPKDKKALVSLNSLNSYKDIFKEDFPFLLPIQEEMAQQLFENPVAGFVTIHTDPWYYKDFMVLVGDAAHGFYPFFGQGTTAAFGDCMALVKLVDMYGPDWQKIFPLYQENRKSHMDTLGELSKEGIMRYARNKRADVEAIYNHLESLGHGILPKYIQPPVFQQVTDNPDKTADYVRMHTKQRRRSKIIGISFAVVLLTWMVTILEKAKKS
jgi:kynurenine 3-monooxygenase